MADTTVCSSDSTKSTDHKASVRKSNKPLMEKKRRARINSCLGQLKSLVLQALKKDTSQFSKLEKADILEMTVKHLKTVQQQHMSVAMATDPNVVTKYRAGFNECAGEVMRYLGSVNGLTEDTRTRVLNHLALCMQSVNTAASVSMATQAAAAANQAASLGGHVGSCGMPTVFPSLNTQQPQSQTTQVMPTQALPVSAGNNPIPTLKVPTPRLPQQVNDCKFEVAGQNSLQLIPGTLPTGQLAFFVASPTTMQTPIQAIPVYTSPSNGSPSPVSSPDISPRRADMPTPHSPGSPLISPTDRFSPQSEQYTGHQVQLNLSPRSTEKKSSPRVETVTRRSYSPLNVPPINHSPQGPHCHPHQYKRDTNTEGVEGIPNDHDTDDEEKVWRPW